MRIWHPIPPLCLDDKRLSGEHRELHAIWSVLTNPSKTGYRRHPETLRWQGNLPGLIRRHNLLVLEMQARGWNHRSPLPHETPFRFEEWPEPWEPVELMREKLAAKLEAA